MSHREIIIEALTSYQATISNSVRLGNRSLESKLASINAALYAAKDDGSFIFLGSKQESDA